MKNCNTIPALPITMNSREIAALVEKRHDNVKRTIDTLAERGTIRLPQIEFSEEINNLGFPVKREMYVFDLASKRDSFIVVAQLSPEFTARLVDRWQELEAAAVAPAPAVELSRMDLIQLALSAEKERLALVAHVEVIQPKADAFDRIATSTCGSLNLTNAAKSLQVQPGAFIQRLNSMRWIYKRAGGRSWIAYQDRLQQGVLEHKVAILTDAAGTEKVREQVFVTAQGLALLAKALNQQPATTQQLPQLSLNGIGGAA